MSIMVGMKGRAERKVDQSVSAQEAGSGTLPVLATPWMCALMEQSAWTAVADALEAGESTVGTKLSISHSSATPLGLMVWAQSEVTEIEGKRIEFNVTAYDEKGIIGAGTHQRFVVNDQRFLSKAAQKLEG